MNLQGLKAGDIVRAEKKGMPPFYGEVQVVGPGVVGSHDTEVRKGELAVTTIGNGRHLRLVTAREVVGKWGRRAS